MNATDLEYGLQYCFVEWYIWCSFIKSLFFAFIIASVSAYFGYTVEGGSIAVGKASTDSVVMSSVLILFSDLVLTQLLMDDNKLNHYINHSREKTYWWISMLLLTMVKLI